MQRGGGIIVGGSGVLRHAARRRAAGAPLPAASNSSALYLSPGSVRDRGVRKFVASAACQTERAWQPTSIRLAQVQAASSSRLSSSSSNASGSGSTTQQAGDAYPPPPPPQRRRPSNAGLGTRGSTLHATPVSRVKATARHGAPRAEVSQPPKGGPERVGTTKPEDPPPKEGDNGVPLPDDPNSPLRKEAPVPKDALNTPSPAPRQDPQDLKRREKKKSLKEKVIGLWEKIKYLFRFYYNGVKQIWKNRGIVAEMRKAIKQRKAEGKGEMRWMEKSIIELHQADLSKLPLFLAILLILEEVLPLVVIYAPSLLPSTCILPSQSTKMRSGEERRRGIAIQELAKENSITEAVGQIGHIKKQDSPSIGNQQSSALTVLADVSPRSMKKLAEIFALQTWGPKSMVQRRIESHLHALQNDDVYLLRAFSSRPTGRPDDARKTPQQLPTNEWRQICESTWLERACARRGLRAFEASNVDMVRNLEAYLHLAATAPASTHSLSNNSSNNLTPLEHALLPLALYDGTRSHLVRLELDAMREQSKGWRQRTHEVVASVVTAEKQRKGGAKGALR